MRVLVAPDKFAGTLTAAEAAAAIADGWRRGAPQDRLDLAPLSDGGPGLVDVLQSATGGRLETVTVRGPFGDPVEARLLIAAATAYVESAQACGLALTGGRGAGHATSYGVGELVRAAIGHGARRVVIGLGGSGSNDGGAGLLAALGATGDRPLDRGGAALADLRVLDLGPAREAVAGIELVAASDVDNPLTGPRGATAVFGPQKGVPPELIATLDAALGGFAAAAGVPADLPGAGAAGGLGFAVHALGGRRRPGIEVVAEAIGLADRVAAADLVITGEGALDATTGGGKAPAGVAALAAAARRPCIALAGRLGLDAAQVSAQGYAGAYSLEEAVGRERALGAAAEALAAVAATVAGRWSAGRGE